MPEGALACMRCGRLLGRPAPVDLRLVGSRPQQRLTVLFRGILAIPHFVYLAVLGTLAVAAAVIGWFAALVLGRLPDGIRLFIGRVVGYHVRVHGYAVFLLTDRYPSFALDHTGHDVEVLLPPPGRLNRGAVLFRLVLAMPAMMVVQVLGVGTSVVMFFLWLVALVTRRLPSAAWRAMAAILRYEARAYAYVLLLTPEYPRGLFGDAAEPSPAVEPSPAAEPEAPAVDGAPEVPGVDGEPRITRLVLGKAAKRVVVLTVVLGIVVGVGMQVALAVAAVQSNRALDQLDSAYAELESASDDFVRQSQACALAGDPACLQAEVTRFAGALDLFLVDLREIDMPQAAVPYARDLEGEGEAMLDSLAGMAGASSEREYLSYVTTFQRQALAFDEAFGDLRRTLFFS